MGPSPPPKFLSLPFCCSLAAVLLLLLACESYAEELQLRPLQDSESFLAALPSQHRKLLNDALKDLKEFPEVQRWEARAAPHSGMGKPWYLGIAEEGWEGEVSGACARAAFSPLLHYFGWNLLSVETSAECSDVHQAFSAGYVEGKLTWEYIWQHYKNEFGTYEPSETLKDYLAKNMDYLEQQVLAHAEGPEAVSSDEAEKSFWWQVGLILAQLKGLEAGYRSVAPLNYTLEEFDFQLLNLHGDIYDLAEILDLAAHGGELSPHSPEEGTDNSFLSLLRLPGADLALGQHVSQGKLRRSLREHRVEEGGVGEAEASSGETGHLPLVYPDECSSIVKVLPEHEDLLTAQATWSKLEGMLRVYKLYSFAFAPFSNASTLIPGNRVTFSSYHGRLFSGDDFYLTSSKLSVQETTIGNSNAELYKKYVKPEGTVLEWMRNVVANRLASSGEEWVSFFSRYNSGTYNNQWMVVDHKRFTSGAPLKPGTLWVLEQLPGHIEAHDVTATLEEHTYWASYNIPAFPSIFNLSGFADLEREYGDFFSHERNVRAKMFRRDHSKVVDVPSLQALIRYNDYKNDPLSACDCNPPYSAELAIAARGDLNLANGTYALPYFQLRDHAETDSKISSSKMLEPGTLACIAISGPTWDQQPPFRWSTSPFANISHLGHPDLFLFPWVSISGM